MRTPEYIIASDFEFSDDRNVEDRPVTIAKFREYTSVHGKKLLLQDNISAFNEFKKGFFIKRYSLHNRQITIQELDALMSGSEINTSTINKIEEKIRRYYNLPDQHSEKIEWFINILKDTGDLFPTHIARESVETYPQNVNDFKKQLLYFWTSTRNYNSQFAYNISFTYTSNIVAHTCSQWIEIPSNISSQTALYELLFRSVIATGFGFA